MSCFDVVRPDQSGDLLVVYQSNFLRQLDSRLVIPLLAMDRHDDVPVVRLNPVMIVNETRYLLWPQSAFGARLAVLGRPFASLEHEHDRIREAFDFLITGF